MQNGPPQPDKRGKTTFKMLETLTQWAKNRAGGFVLVLAGLLLCGSGIMALSDCITATRAVDVLSSVGAQGLSIEGDIQYEIQESRRTLLRALSTDETRAQQSFINQSRGADVRAESLINRLRVLPLTPQLGTAARDFANSWAMYLEMRDDVAALVLAGRRQDAFQADLNEGYPAIQESYER